jgi:hypothetical protein
MVTVCSLIFLGNRKLDVGLITCLPISFCPTVEYQSFVEFHILHLHKISASTDIHNWSYGQNCATRPTEKQPEQQVQKLMFSSSSDQFNPIFEYQTCAS